MNKVENKETCPICNGSGLNDLRNKDKLDENGIIIYHPTECQDCKGAGKVKSK